MHVFLFTHLHQDKEQAAEADPIKAACNNSLWSKINSRRDDILRGQFAKNELAATLEGYHLGCPGCNSTAGMCSLRSRKLRARGVLPEELSE